MGCAMAARREINEYIFQSEPKCLQTFKQSKLNISGEFEQNRLTVNTENSHTNDPQAMEQQELT